MTFNAVTAVLAIPAVAAALLDVEMEVVAVVVVVAGAEDRVEILAAIGPHGIQEATLAEREDAGLPDIDVLAVVEVDAHDVERVALAVLGEGAAAGYLSAGIA